MKKKDRHQSQNANHFRYKQTNSKPGFGYNR